MECKCRFKPINGKPVFCSLHRAAPELLEACKEVVNKLRNEQEAYGMKTHFAEMFGLDQELIVLEDAIAKAEGAE